MIYSFTGHRPQDLICKFERTHPWKLAKIRLLRNFLQENSSQIEYVINGACIGWDVWAMWASIQEGIPVYAYVPFKGQEKRWSDIHQKQYHELLAKCKEVKIICEGEYSAWKMMRRNEAMLKDSQGVLALWNPEKKYGGTWNTVAAATSLGKPILNFYGDKVEEVKLY